MSIRTAGTVAAASVILLLAALQSSAVDRPATSLQNAQGFTADDLRLMGFDNESIKRIDLAAFNRVFGGMAGVWEDLGVDPKKLNNKSLMLVVGDTINGPEAAGLAFARLTFKGFIPPETPASKASLPALEASGKIVVLVGGPAQNSVTEELSKQGLLSEKRHELLNQLTVTTAKTKKGGKFIIVSDKRGYENLPRRGASYSPLALCLPLQLVPVAASIIGAAIASILNLFKTFLESAITDAAKRRHRMSGKILGIRAREVVSVMAAAFVLGVAMSWTYAGPTADFLWLMVLNTFICVFAGLSHEAIHWVAGRLLGIETEYRFWLSGSVGTLFTAFLGNSFGLQGFLLDEVKEGTPRWKVGVMKLTSPVFSALIMVSFAAANFLFPHVVFQMVYSIAAVLAMVEILPFKPMDGYDVRRWNVFIWLVSFLVISTLFAFVSFIM
jgi:hypothetical protein